MASLEGWSSAIELHPRALERLPIVRRQSGWSDSNRRPQRPKRCALTKLRYSPQTDSRSDGKRTTSDALRRFLSYPTDTVSQ